MKKIAATIAILAIFASLAAVGVVATTSSVQQASAFKNNHACNGGTATATSKGVTIPFYDYC